MGSRLKVFGTLLSIQAVAFPLSCHMPCDLLSVAACQLPSDEETAAKADVREVLAKVRACADFMPVDIAQAQVLRRIAVSQARLGNLEAAYQCLDAIELPRPEFGQTTATARRRGYLEMAAAVAAGGDAQAAIHVVTSAPAPYTEYHDQALVRVAKAFAEAGQPKRAREAVEHMRHPRRPYNYALDIAVCAGDKEWASELLAAEITSLTEALESRDPDRMAREEWAGVLRIVGLSRWCGHQDKANTLLENLTQRSSEPEKLRKDIDRVLSSSSVKKATSADRSSATTPEVRMSAIPKLLEDAEAIEDPWYKALELLYIVDLILAQEMPRPRSGGEAACCDARDSPESGRKWVARPCACKRVGRVHGS